MATEILCTCGNTPGSRHGELQRAGHLWRGYRVHYSIEVQTSREPSDRKLLLSRRIDVESREVRVS